MIAEAITSRDNPLVRRTAALLTDASARREARAFIAEGPVMLGEALRSGVEILRVFARRELLPELPALECPVHPVSEPVLSKLSGVPAPQGVVFVCAMPRDAALTRGAVLALDELRDPGNMGTILRTAEAFGVRNVALLGRCVDPYAPKVVRAAMGSLFRVRPVSCTMAEVRAACPGPVLAAVLDGDSRPIGECSLRDACVVIGNEAHGVSPEVRAACDGGVHIPICGAESLNAAMAAGIFLYEMARAGGRNEK